MPIILNQEAPDRTELPRLLSSLNEYLDKDVANATTLLPEHYTNEALFNLEIEQIWKKNWICVGHTHQFKNPGDYTGLELLNEPIVIVKGEDNEIRALSAVCRHRFMPIVSHGERGNISQLQCIYHRWTYGLNGQLNQATFMESNNCFDKSDIKLREFRLEIWNNFIFINLDDDAEPLAPKLVELDPYFKPQVAETKPEWYAMEYYDKEWEANWKTSNENSLESYHHMGVHLGSLELFAPTRNLEDPMIAKEEWSRWCVPYDMERQAAKDMVKVTGWKDGMFGQNNGPVLEIIMIPPTNAITISPGGVGWFTMWPTGLESTRVFCASIGERSPDRDRYIADMVGDSNPNENYIERVMDEDGLAMPGIRRAIRAGNLQPGKLSWTEEPILRWYQWIARKLAQ